MSTLDRNPEMSRLSMEEENPRSQLRISQNDALEYMQNLVEDLLAMAVTFDFPKIEGAMYGAQAVIRHQCEAAIR